MECFFTMKELGEGFDCEKFTSGVRNEIITVRSLSFFIELIIDGG
jgi:hypothetical protein